MSLSHKWLKTNRRVKVAIGATSPIAGGQRSSWRISAGRAGLSKLATNILAIAELEAAHRYRTFAPPRSSLHQCDVNQEVLTFMTLDFMAIMFATMTTLWDSCCGRELYLPLCGILW
jgi:hypothetical protein